MNRRAWIRSATVAAAGAACLSRPLSAATADAAPEPASSRPFVNLSINENQFGPSPKALQAMQKALSYAHEYPLEGQERLKLAIARREGVLPSQVILGSGSSDILMGASYLFGADGGSFVSADPTFTPMMNWAEKLGVQHLKLPWTADHQTDLDAIERSIRPDTRVVYICNPENPVGTIVAPDTLYAFCQRVCERCPVLVDEAYLDFAGDASNLGMMRCVREGMPVIVLRTFSKAYGLGGMRVGYAVTTPEIAQQLGQRYVTGIGCGCSHASLEGALAAYEDQTWLDHVRQQTADARATLSRFLQEKGVAYIPSVTTFVLAPTRQPASQIADAVYGGFKIKISPRRYFGQEYLRFSLGTPHQMDRLLEALSVLL